MNRTTEQPETIAVIRPGLLDRLKTQSGIRSDEAFARTIGILRAPGCAAAESPAIAALAAAPDPSIHQESPRP